MRSYSRRTSTARSSASARTARCSRSTAQGYGGIWGKVRDSLPDDAIVNYQWIESICVDEPWYRGRTIIIGDAAHACPPLIAQGAAMCAEDAVILAEMLTSGDPEDSVDECCRPSGSVASRG